MIVPCASSSQILPSDPHQQQQLLEFNTSAVKRSAILQKENESLRQELTQMRMAMLQLSKQQHSFASPTSVPTTTTTPTTSTSSQPVNNSSTTAGSAVVTFDTRKGGGGAAQMSKARRERVKVAFSIMSVKHAMLRLRHSVDELRTGVDSDFIDAKRMIDDKKVSIDARIATERPLIYRIHEAICDLVRHGGNQRADVLQHLFSSTSWGTTALSLTQAAPLIVHELKSLVAVADQQRRAKEILEVAAVHKDRALERANRCVVEMAITARDVVASFAGMARSVHNMANGSTDGANLEKAEAISNVKSLLVTRALTIPDLEKYIPVTTNKRSGAEEPPKELSLKQIEKFSRHLQDAAFAATTLLQSATQAVLEPESVKTGNNNNNNNNVAHAAVATSSLTNINNNKRKRSISFQDTQDPAKGEESGATESNKQQASSTKNNSGDESKSLVSILRKRWVKSVFERAMLRLKYRKCLASIHDDFVLNNLIYEIDRTAEGQHKKSTTNTKKKDEIDPNVKWSSASVRPKAPISTSANNQQMSTSNNNNNNNNNNAPWTTEDDRRLKLHEQRHAVRVKQVFGVDEPHDDAQGREKKKTEMKQTLTRQFLELSAEVEGNTNSSMRNAKDIKKSNSAFQGHHHLKATYLTSRRAMAAPAGSSANNLGNLLAATTNAAKLGRLSPLTGTVETAHSNNNVNSTDGVESGWKRVAKSDYVASTTANNNNTSTQHQHQLIAKNPHDDITEGMRVKDPRWFQPITKTTAGATTTNVRGMNPNSNANLAPHPPSNNNKFTHVPVGDTLKHFFVLSNEV